ncbi:MAG: FtsQ-type POTRA domain-containing protein [Candidatus Eremiobacteraeota bacterium]|nr:FtsQ-type POTRA domain-containing protein [Candidatus Eremiobacteraeota bacterium]
MSVRVRRRSKPSLLVRLRIFWVFIAVALAAAAYAGYVLATWPGFNATSVVVDGNKHVSSDEILARAAIPRDRNIWLVDKRGAERRVEALPWIESARIHRSLPAAVTLVVAERVPAACALAGSARYLVDGEAHVLATDCNWPAQLLDVRWPPLAQAQRPGAVLDAPRLERLLRDDAVLRAQHLDPATVGIDRFDGLEVTLRGGPLVRFGDDADLSEKAKLVEPILRTYAAEAKGVAVVDVRSPAAPVVEERKRP